MGEAEDEPVLSGGLHPGAGQRDGLASEVGLFLAALALIVAALAQAQMALFLAGTVVRGAAVGAVFMGSLATANRLIAELPLLRASDHRGRGNRHQLATAPPGPQNPVRGTVRPGGVAGRADLGGNPPLPIRPVAPP